MTIQTGSIDHLRLTVTDVAHSRQFYTELLGFSVAMEMPNGVLLSNGSLLLGLGTAPDPASVNQTERFDENRVGLDHLSFSVNGRHVLETASQLFAEHNVTHSDIKDMGENIGIYILAFRDPDNIQLELTAPYS